MATSRSPVGYPSSTKDDPLLVRCIVPPLVVLSMLVGCRPRRQPKADWNDPLTSPSGPVARSFERLLLSLASQDWMLLGYLLVLLTRVAANDGPRRLPAMVCLGVDIATFALVLFVVRGGLVSQRASAIVYRAALFVPVLGSFLQLQYILPAASGPAMDGQLYALDIRLFGFEPAEAWDRFVHPATTEWFAFFYYGYFLLIALHVFPLLLFGRGRTLTSFGLGFLWVYCAGHAIYTFVPAFGPYDYLAPRFHHTLAGPLWWPLVKSAVASVNGRMRTDVFPSLHTAVPTFLAAFSFKNRKLTVFRYTWLPVSLFATQMIAATMFLRWHYVIDVIAGLLLAASAFLVTRAGLVWDEARIGAGGPDVWPVAASTRVPHSTAPASTGNEVQRITS